MKIAVVSSRNITKIDISKYVSACDEIVSVGADSCAAECAKSNNLELTEFLPQYKLYGRAAPTK